jgi:hypothetical protein
MGNKTSNSRHDTDVNLGREMNELSVPERQKVLDDIHGVAEAQEETPELLEKSLAQLDKAICSLPRPDRKALDHAIFLRPELKNDIKFKIMFLRADYFVADLSAKRMALYFKYKLELFGEDKLVKKLSVEDLQEQDRNKSMAGFFLELPERDPIGRQVEARSGLICYPNLEDALIGRGYPYRIFSGTTRLLQMIDSESERYAQSSDNFSKTCIAMEGTISDEQRYDLTFVVLEQVSHVFLLK